MSTVVRVLVVDDHPLFRRGLTALLATDQRFDVIGEAGDAGQAQQQALRWQPDVILLDNHLPGVQGIAAIPSLLEAAPKTKILMLTVSEDQQDLASALRAGAHGYLLKTVDSDLLASAIVRAVQGQTTVSTEMTDKLIQSLRAMPDAQVGLSTQLSATPAQAPQASDEPALESASTASDEVLKALSPREQQILAMLADGARNKEIARALDISEATVKIHVQNMLRKTGFATRVQLAVNAMDWLRQRSA